MPMWLRFALFFGLVLVLLVAANSYVFRRAAKSVGLGVGGRRALGALLAASLLALVAGRTLASALGDPIAEGLAIFGSTVQLGVIISVALLLPIDLGRLLAAAWARLRRRPEPAVGVAEPAAPVAAPVPVTPMLPHASRLRRSPTSPRRASLAGAMLLRREFLSRSATGTALAVGGGSSAYGALLGRHDYRIEEVPVAIAGLSPAMDGYAIVQLSDIHFGTFVGEPEIEAAVDLVRSARPDAIVLTGDLVDHDPRYAELLGRLVRRLTPLSRDGVFAIPGNHDYYAGIGDVLNALRSAGAHVLVNTGRVIGDAGGAFALLGVDDLWASRVIADRGPDLSRALRTVPRDLPRVLLAHQPEMFAEAAPHVALQLSGHTHGGQVQLGINPARWVLPHGWVEGRYERDGGTLYVNRGFGTAGPPARVGSPPEVTRVVLVAA